MEARKTRKKPYWIFDDVWNFVLSQWSSPMFYAKFIQAQKYQTYKVGGCLRPIGSITLMSMSFAWQVQKT